MGLKLNGRPIVPGVAKGIALVSKKPISFLGGVDPDSGIIVEVGHDLKGECVKGRILCFPHGHGSTVGSYVLYSLVKNGVGPKAIVNAAADPVVVVGAVIADIPMVDQVDIEQMRTGDLVEVDGEAGVVNILTRKR
ncbi:MAG: DUF126 domain-containing protein [Candidatus Bathyarchaeia archaeon]